MFRFAKTNGDNFNLDEVGTINIGAFDSGGDLVAICLVNPKQLEEDFVPLSFNDAITLNFDEEDLENWVGGNPLDVDHWEVVIKMEELPERYLQYALVQAFSAMRLCEYLVRTSENE